MGERESLNIRQKERRDLSVCWMRKEKDVYENDGESERGTVVDNERKHAKIHMCEREGLRKGG